MVEKQGLMRSDKFACFLFISLIVLILILNFFVHKEPNISSDLAITLLPMNIISSVNAKISGWAVSDEGDILVSKELPYIYYEGEKLYIHPTDNSEGVLWGDVGIPIGPGAQSDTNGFTNTVAIVGALGEGSYAAKVCSDLSFGGYDDWYLPAKNQMREIYYQMNNISKGDYEQEWTNFSLLSLGFCWTSTESLENPASNAWDIFFIDGTPGSFNKDTLFIVRCVRGGKITPSCGDGSCNSGETCSSCQSDCGSCSGHGRDDGEIILTSPVNLDITTETSQNMVTEEIITIKINNQSHEIKTNLLNTTSARIIITSTPQTATFIIGDEKKFELTGDDFYDLSIRLNSIFNNQVSLTLKKINEKILVSNLSEIAETGQIIEDEINSSKANVLDQDSVKILIISIVALVVLIGLVVLIVFLKLRKKHDNTVQFESRDNFDEARKFVLDARIRGYNDEQIRKGFEDKGWKNTDIDNILR